MRLILSFLLILSAQAFLSLDIKAQTQPLVCPSIKIRDEEGDEVQGLVGIGNITFTVDAAGNFPTNKPKFDWTISGGKIIGGQETPTIIVATGENLGQEITATVEVGGISGISPGCDKRTSATVRVGELFCPTLSINCPTDIFTTDKPGAVSLNISGGSPHWNPKYKWQVSAGKIISGQGTPVISVDISQTDGESVTATVEIDGMRPECPKSASCTLSVATYIPPPLSRKFDEYGDVSWINEEVRLANFGIQLKEEPGATGHVIIYGSRQIAQHLARVRKFLVEKRGINPERIVLVHGGYNKKTKVELWAVPTGAELPKPDPNF
jgi:hypothetical protein